MKRSNLQPQRSPATRRIAGRAQQDDVLDPYQRQQKLDDGTRCPQCGAVYRAGRWQWTARSAAEHQALCPACRRINDKYPAGTVLLRGAFARAHREEILRLARHQEEAERTEHPLNRIMTIEEDAQGTAIGTTDIHLPRRIGEAVERAFHGALDIDFEKDGYSVRITWTREA
jgi:NMD protein affecting ribosome stability and mRNA decay